MSNDLRTAAQQALAEPAAPACKHPSCAKVGRCLAVEWGLIEHPEAAPTVVEPDAYGYASRLAVAIWEKHYKDESPQWKPLDDLLGVLTQIDNMTAGLTRQQPEPAAPLKRGTTGICTRVVCECEQNRLGPECVYLRPRMPTQGQLSALEALTADAEALGLYEAAPTAVEPVAWASPSVIPLREGQNNHPCVLTDTRCAANTVPLYATPPRAALSDEEIYKIGNTTRGQQGGWNIAFARAIEKAHGIGEPRNE